MRWRAYAERDVFSNGAALRFAAVADSKIEEAVSLTFETRLEGEPTKSPPILRGDSAISFMQAIMDAAYEYGLRPSKAQDERHMAKHLEDMREISRHLLKMPIP